jgi:protein ImuA
MSSAANDRLLTRDRRHRVMGEGVRFLGRLAMARGRVHEICGSARWTLALIVAAACQGEVIWITPAWATDRLNGDGVTGLIRPGRLVFVTPRQAEDLLWCAEEALRSGAVPLVVADMPGPPELTPIRRLHLAAEAGAERGASPLGIVLTPEGAAAGVESRWAFAQAEHGWRLERLRTRIAPPKTWHVAEQDRRLIDTASAAVRAGNDLPEGNSHAEPSLRDTA